MSELPVGVTFTLGNQEYPDVADLVTTTETPGGLKEARFSLSSKDGVDIRWDDNLIIYDANEDRWPFVGRISTVHRTGLCYEFVATRSTRLRVIESTTGFGNPSHPSGIYAGRIYKPGTLVATALTDALQLCEAVFDGGINPLTGIQFVTDSSNVAGYTAEQMWDYVSGLLSGFSTPLLWHVRATNNVQVVVIDFQDIAPRYRVELAEDKIDEIYDSEQIITNSAVEWGNDQVYAEGLLNLVQSGRQLRHGKYVNGSRELVSLNEAQGLVGDYLARFGLFKASTTTLTLKCDEDIVQVVEPIATSDNWPLWLLESGHGIHLIDRPISLEPYNEADKYIIGTTYTWKTGVLVAQCGTAGGGLDSRIQRVVDYNVNRLFFGPYNGPPGGNHPLADADLLPQVGPEVRAGEAVGEPPVTSYGIGAFRSGLDANGGDPNVPYGKQLDPDIVPDEGLEANVNFDPSELGFQAAVRVTPGTFNQYRLILGNAAGLVADSVTAEFYRIIPTSEHPLGGQQFLFSISSLGLKDTGPQAIVPLAILKRGDYAMIKVTEVGASATWAAVSLHAKKDFPALKSKAT